MNLFGDMADRYRKVTVGNREYRVRGLTLPEIADIVGRFPDIMSLFDEANRTPATLMTVAGKAIGPIIAGGFGYLGDAEAEADAGLLAPADQLAFVVAIWERTFPDGIGPFVEMLASIRPPTTDTSSEGATGPSINSASASAA